MKKQHVSAATGRIISKAEAAAAPETTFARARPKRGKKIPAYFARTEFVSPEDGELAVIEIGGQRLQSIVIGVEQLPKGAQIGDALALRVEKL